MPELRTYELVRALEDGRRSISLGELESLILFYQGEGPEFSICHNEARWRGRLLQVGGAPKPPEPEAYTVRGNGSAWEWMTISETIRRHVDSGADDWVYLTAKQFEDYIEHMMEDSTDLESPLKGVRFKYGTLTNYYVFDCPIFLVHDE